MSVEHLIRTLAEKAGEQLASGDVEKARDTLTWRAQVRDETLTYAEFVAACDGHVEFILGKAVGA